MKGPVVCESQKTGEVAVGARHFPGPFRSLGERQLGEQAALNVRCELEGTQR